MSHAIAPKFTKGRLLPGGIRAKRFDYLHMKEYKMIEQALQPSGVGRGEGGDLNYAQRTTTTGFAG